MRYILFLLLIVLFISGCGNGPDPSKLKRYPITGKVVSVDKKSKSASIDHEAITGYMSAMTMDFKIKEDWVWGELKPGAGIKAELVVDNVNGEFWLEKIALTSPPIAGLPTPAERKKPPVGGKPIIEFSLTDQDNNKITPADFKGKVWAITFIYSECPLPEFCIAMSKNFSDLANKIAEDDSLKDKVGLLSISFDPKRDTPEKLRKYGLGYLGKDSKAADFKIWKLATGKDEEVRKIAEFFGLRYKVNEKDKTTFDHSLRTALISPEGNYLKVIPGGGWEIDMLMTEFRALAK